MVAAVKIIEYIERAYSMHTTQSSGGIKLLRAAVPGPRLGTGVQR